jgi:O-antigen/teichoic acid export membrane protein
VERKKNMPESTPVGQKAVHGVFWTYLAYYSGKFLVLVSTIILARLLSKDDFGVAGYALTAISFLEVAADLGIGPALIYHRDEPDSVDTAFWLGMLLSFVMGAITWAMAPVAGTFFNDLRAVPVIRALAFSFPIAGLGNIHNVLLRKELSFRRKFIPDISRSAGKGVISIILAAVGFGPWSLIVGQLAGGALGTMAVWLVHPWRPSFQFALDKSKALLSYGVNIVAVDGLGIILTNTDYLVVGRYLGAEALGIYTLAFRIPDMLIMQFCYLVGTVVFPLYSKLRDDSSALTRGFLTTTRYVALVTVPLSLGMMLVAQPLILLVFGEKWQEAVPVLQAISIYSLMLSLAYNAGDVYKAQGRPDVLTRISLARVLVLVPGLYWAASQVKSIEMVGWTHAVVAFLFGLITLMVASRLLDAPLKELVVALRPAALAGAGMALVLVSLKLVLQNAGNLIQLVSMMAVGAIVYTGLLWVTERPVVLETVEILRGVLAK